MILPESSYSKYIRLFFGFILMINIIMPFKNFDYNINDYNFDSFKSEVVINSNNNFEIFLKNEIVKNVRRIINSNSEFDVSDVDVDFDEIQEDYFYIKTLTVKLDNFEYELSSSDKKNLINLINQEYFNYIDNIYIEYRT